MKDKIDNILGKVTKIKDFIDNEAFAIEKEVNAHVRESLEIVYPGFTVINVLQELPDIKTFFEPDSNDKITEFDGLYIVSTDPNFKIDPQEKSIIPKTPDTKTILVIVESKHTLTISKVNTKLEQITRIQRAFEMARDLAQNNNSHKVSKSFLWRMKAYQLYNLEPEIHLLLGGPYVNESTMNYVEELGEILWKHSPSELKLSKSKTIDIIAPIRMSMF